MSESPFLKSLEQFMFTRRYSRRTISTYRKWIKDFILFHDKKHPKELDEQHIGSFLTHLAVERHVAAATQALALNAVVFLYHQFLKRPLKNIGEFKRSKRQAKLPVVLSKEEVKNLLHSVKPPYKLMVSFLYASGLRRIELLRLRVHDIDLSQLQIRVWNGKGSKHRITTLAPELIPAIKRQINRVN